MESMKEGELELRKSAKDNYSFILPVFNYGTREQAMSLNPFMDRAIEKAAKVIQKHSMSFNDVEYINWVDDSYLMIGMAYFYKQEYLMARRTFDYVIKTYSYDPIKYEAMIWLANTYIQQKEWDKAQSLLDLVQSEIDKGTLSLKMVKRLPLVYADFYVRQGFYKLAVDHLERGVEVNSNNYIVTRSLFILGQIYQAEGDYEAASEYYTRLIKKGPSYELAFNAKINLAQSYTAATGDKRLIIKQLQKMLRDIKNEEYLDQIYYALAEIALRDGDDSLGISYLRLSVSSSVSNFYQMSISALRLGDLYYSKPDYSNSQLYYDTAVQFLPKDYPNYEEIVTKTQMLTELVTNLIIVQVQDSLQKIALMPEKDRIELIDNMIGEYNEWERQRKEQEALMQQQTSMASSTFQTQQNMDRLSGGKWYFYNSSTLSFGYNEFIKKWGNRKLEDLWRLKNKQIISFDITDELAEADSTLSDSTAVLSTDPTKRETYLQNLPLTDELMAGSHEMIAGALYKLGYIYEEGLKNYDKAIESFKQLIDRYPENEHVLEAYYHLYKIYGQKGDTEREILYRDLIVNNYPGSDYAKIIIDPNYNLVLIAQRNKAANLYEETYEAFVNGQYLMVRIYSDEAIATYPEDKDLIPKFEYLRALAIGRTEGRDSLAVMLQQIITKYPVHEVTPLAQNILNHLYIKETKPGATGEGTQEEIAQAEQESLEIISPYVYKPDVIHFYIMVVDASKVNVNATKVKISDHNMKYHKLDNLTISSVLLDGQRQMITVSNFSNKDKALAYYNGIINNEYVFSGIPSDGYSHFVVSADNYRIFYESKDTREYLRFFDKNYLAQK
jgi:tetratricopeptide (TPR) repeat protein